MHHEDDDVPLLAVLPSSTKVATAIAIDDEDKDDDEAVFDSTTSICNGKLDTMYPSYPGSDIVDPPSSS